MKPNVRSIKQRPSRALVSDRVSIVSNNMLIENGPIDRPKGYPKNARKWSGSVNHWGAPQRVSENLAARARTDGPSWFCRRFQSPRRIAKLALSRQFAQTVRREFLAPQHEFELWLTTPKVV